MWKLEQIFNTVSSSQAPNSANKRKTFETLKNSLKSVDRIHLVEVKAEVAPSKFAEFCPWQLRELGFPSPGNYPAAILRQHLCSTGAPVLMAMRAEFLIGYCMLCQTLNHDFQEAVCRHISCILPCSSRNTTDNKNGYGHSWNKK